MPTPPSPDKALVVTSSSGKDSDNTGWLLQLLHGQKEFLLTLIEANNDRYDQRHEASNCSLKELMLAIIQANDVRYDQRFEASKEAVSAALNAAKEAITAALSASDRAVNKAELASEKRFEGVNEFRNTLADQQRTLMPRAEAEVLFKSMSEKIRTLEIRHTEDASTRQGIGDGWRYALGAIGLFATILSIASVVITLIRR